MDNETNKITNAIIEYLKEYKTVSQKHEEYSEKYDDFLHQGITNKLYGKYTIQLSGNGFRLSYPTGEYDENKEWIPLTDLMMVEKDTESQFVGLSDKEYRFWFNSRNE